MAIAKTTFATGSVVEPTYLNEIPMANSELQHARAVVVLESITQSPGNSWITAPFGTIDVAKHGIVGSRMVNVSGYFSFKASAAVNYLTILLPSGYRPHSSYLVDNVLAKCSVISDDTGSLTDIQGVYIRPRLATNDGHLYIGNKELCLNFPATQTFANAVLYHVGFTLNYKLYSGD